VNDLFIWSLAAAVGGLCGFLLGLRYGSFKQDRYLRKGLLEILGAGLTGSLLALPALVLQIPTAFVAGLAWSFLCQRLRNLLTTRIVDALTPLRKWWLEYCHKPGDTPDAERQLAVAWPTIFWSQILHGVGLTNLSNGQLTAYEKYRAELAYRIECSDTSRRRQARPSQQPSWLWNRGLLLVSIALVGTTVYVLVLTSKADYSHLDYEHLIQALVIFLLFLASPDPVIDEYRNPDEADAAKSFCRYWRAFQASWVLLYVVFFLGAIIPATRPGGSGEVPAADRDPGWEVATHFAYNVNTYLLVMCFLVLHDPPYISSKHTPTVTRARLIGPAAVIAFTAAEAWCYAHDRAGAIVWINWLTGFAGGVALALVVGRLESKLINTPILLIVALYFYAVIQGAMGSFRGAEDVKHTLLSLALPLKCLLLVCVAWFTDSGKLFSYMTDVRILQSPAEDTVNAPGKTGVAHS
jgi:hypothetical protein